MAYRLLQRIHRQIRQCAVGIANSVTGYRLRKISRPVFTQDYCSWLAGLWSEHLRLFKDGENLRFLEIGSFEGRSAIWFLENILTHPGARLTCVDRFQKPGLEARFNHNIRCAGLNHKIIKIKGKSAEFMATFDGEPFDLIYIDGSHRALDVLQDAFLGWRLLKPGGLMIFDDYLWRTDQPPLTRPQLGIDIFMESISVKAELQHRDYQVILRKI
jgi:hypothetical protein